MRRLEIVLLSAAAFAASILLAFWPHDVQDYARDAGPALHPFVNGNFGAAFAHQPAMGWFSMLLRAPFAFFGRHHLLLEYRLGAIPCVLVAAGLGVWLASRARRRGASIAIALAVLAFTLAGPMTWHALADGHPEEVLGAALCVLAVMLAAKNRNPVAAGLTLGLALATKQWAVLAIGPVLLAAPSRRPRLAATALATAGALTLLPILAGGHHVLSPATSISGAGIVIEPASIWWPFGHAIHIRVSGFTAQVHTLPQWLANLAHPLIVALGVLLPLGLAARTRSTRADLPTALALLALLFLLRCVLDPMTVGYYHLPLMLALVAYEAHDRRGVPVLTLLSSAVLLFLVTRLRWGLEPAKVATIYLAWALPLAAYLGARVYAPTVMSSFGKWLSTSLPESVTTTRSSIRTPNAPGT
jgi:glycosyl transferase family 87